MTSHAWHPSRTLLAIAAILTAACGSDSGTSGGNTGNNVPCTITLSGARSGPLTCSDVSAVLTANDNETGFGLQGTSATDSLFVGIGFSGAPVVHTYTASDASPTITLITPIGAWTTTQNDGSMSLDITSVKQLDNGPDLIGYEVHGTLTLTMVEEVGAGSPGPVTVNVKF
ncbi:MAG: hypothetical protein ACREK8_03430 [Gemmatimonadales bacterium]